MLARWLPFVYGLVVLVGFGLLVLVVRAQIAAAAAVLMNLLATAAAFGIAKLIFQDGHLQGLLGFSSQGFVDAWAPIFFFALIFALAMDYTVFLLSSTRAELQRSGDLRAALVEGLAHSGRVINAAGGVMVVVFFTFALSGPLAPKEMGVILGVAVLLDTLLIRLLLLPAVLRLLGPRAWWAPRRLARLSLVLRRGLGGPLDLPLRPGDRAMSELPMITSLSHALAEARQAELRRVARARRAAGPGRTRRHVSAGNVAFLCLFAAQAGVLTLSPILPSVAHEFGISTAAAGQLRTLAGLSGGLAALAVVLVGARVGLRRLLLAGSGLLAFGSAASAAAPTLTALAGAQAAVGAAVGLLISGGLAAAAAWAPVHRQTKTVAWASLGQPASWVVAMPLVGLTADLGWRYTWLGVPLAAGLAALAAVHSGPADRGPFTPGRRVNSLRWDAKLVGWTLGELLGYAGWGGALVYAGALLIESYHAAPGTAGLLLGAAAIAAFPGNFLVRRWLSDSARELLMVLGLSAAVITAVFGTVRPGILISTGTFTLLVLVATTRTVAGSAFALYVAPERRLAVMGVRASTAQLGYLLGGAAGGAALATGGFPALGLTLAALFALGTAPHIRTLLAERAGQRHAGSGGSGLRPAAQHGGDALALMRVTRFVEHGQTGPRVRDTRAPHMYGDLGRKDRADPRGATHAVPAVTAIRSKNSMPATDRRLRDGVAKHLARPGQRGAGYLSAHSSYDPTEETP